MAMKVHQEQGDRATAPGGRLKRAAAMGAAVSAMAVGLAVLPPATAANAYDGNSCSSKSTVYDVDRFRFDGGPIDFGDELHLNGAPQGDAVTCWQQGRSSVQLRGKMFLDPGRGFKGCVRIVLRFYNTANTNVTSGNLTKDLCDAEGDDWFPTSYTINKTVTAANLNKASVIAYKKSTTDTQWQHVRTANTFYGD
jgi:hypothetical protein